MPAPAFEPDEWLPRERGLMIGNTVARQLPRGELAVENVSPGDMLNLLAANPPTAPPQLHDWIMDDGGIGRPPP